MTRKRSSLGRVLCVAALFGAFIGLAVAPARADLVDDRAASLKAGFEAYKRGDYVTTIKEIGPLAKRGNISAQHLLGVMLAEGRGVAKDPVMALAWLTCSTAPRKDDADGGGAPAAQGQSIDKEIVQAVLLRDSLTRQLPQKLTDKARRIAKGCKTVAARAKIEEEELRNFYRAGILERIFFFAGDTIIIGLMVIAKNAGLDGMNEVLNSLINVFGNLLLGLISIVWWFFAGRIFFIIAHVVQRHTHDKVLREGLAPGGPLSDEDKRRRNQLL